MPELLCSIPTTSPGSRGGTLGGAAPCSSALGGHSMPRLQTPVTLSRPWSGHTSHLLSPRHVAVGIPSWGTAPGIEQWREWDRDTVPAPRCHWPTLLAKVTPGAICPTEGSTREMWA